MNDFLKKLHEKPEHKRRTVALGLSASITTFIFIIWFSVYSTGFGGDIARAKDSTTSPLDSFRENTANAFSGFAKALGGAKQKVEEISTDIKAEYTSNMSQTYTASSTQGMSSR